MKKETPSGRFHYSPSEYHLHIMGKAARSMSYRGGDFKMWKRKLQSKIKNLIGFEIPAHKTPLNVKTLWKRDISNGTIEKIVYTSEPYCDVPAYACIPKNFKPPYNWIICLQGHSSGMHNSIAIDLEHNRKLIKVVGDIDFALGCLSRGFAALCIEQRSFGERAEKKQVMKSEHSCHDAVMQSLLLGKTLIAERVYDVDRGIDYLTTRKDVDMKRIGIMGNSGGGTISTYSSAILPRISFAVPSCCLCTFADSIMRIYHCGDNYVPGILKYCDFYDVLGLLAPKPVVVVAGRNDNLFPLEGVRKAFSSLKKIYRAAGAENNCRLVIGDGGHRFYADAAWPVLQKLMNDI